VWEEIPKSGQVWGDERAMFIIFKARLALSESIKTFRSRGFTDEDPESFLDFQILIALYAEELGIIARAVKSYVNEDNLTWIDEEEDQAIEKEIVQALNKLGTLKAIYSRWLAAKETDEFKRKRKGLPLIPID